MIISGYQGIGKSTLAGKENCIDLESSNFWVNSRRSESWYKIYCKIANDLSKQGYIVFVSSHEIVRKELEKSKEKVLVIIPSLALKDEWINKLEERYHSSKNNKNKKALDAAKVMYSNSILEIMNGNLPYYVINNMDYNLLEIIKEEIKNEM